jgi:hypothetical protein
MGQQEACLRNKVYFSSVFVCLVAGAFVWSSQAPSPVLASEASPLHINPSIETPAPIHVAFELDPNVPETQRAAAMVDFLLDSKALDDFDRQRLLELQTTLSTATPQRRN